MAAVHYESYTQARAHLKDLLDAADEGRVATVRRDSGRSAVLDVERLRHCLSLVRPSKAEVVAEANGWSVRRPRSAISQRNAKSPCGCSPSRRCVGAVPHVPLLYSLRSPSPDPGP
ncbi:hypothetical protein [Streptomyces griseoruber]|uniref:hypothetical protein n=1 Tax=Streptomyces griseoruber TaxID=1943 RepID=UPI000ACF72D1|nr:hypothetical protein [Streptomyces griseoruber]